MRILGTGATALALLLGAPPLPGQAGEAGRYTLTPVAEGMMRFDTRTGAMALCRRVEFERRWTCDTVSEGNRALHRQMERLQQEVERLQRENATLKSEVERFQAAARASPPPPARGFPDDGTAEEMRRVLETIVGKVRTMIGRLQPQPKEKRL